MRTVFTLSRRVAAPLMCLLVAASSCREPNPLGPGTKPGLLDGPAGPLTSHGQPVRPAPFAGKLASTQEILDSPPRAGCQLSATTVLEGELTALGRFSGQGRVCVLDVQAGIQNPPFNPGGGPPPYLVADFVVEHVYTAPNGDLLEISGQAVRVQSLTDGTSGFIGQGVIDGGTGRFEGASGAFDIVGVQGWVTYDGWILYDASNRARN